jgi:gp32-like DNA binding protein
MPTLSPELLKLVKSSKNKHTRAGNSVQLKEGKTTIRIIPNTDGSQFWADLGVHWIKTEIKGKPVAVVGCHDEVYGQPCPVCTAIAQATAAATSDEEIALIKEWKANKTVIVNALVRSGPDKSEDPQIVELKSSVWGQISGMIAEYAEADVDLLDLLKGQDFVVERRGRGQNDTKYTVMLAPKSEPVKKDVLERVHDLKGWIESQFFRGDETKALTAIANVTGVSVSASARLAAPARSALLTKPAAVVEDAEVAEVAEAIVEAEAEAEAVQEEVATDDDAAAQAEAEAAAAAAAAAEAAAKAALAKAAALKAAAAKKPAPKPTPKPAAKEETKKDDAFNADLPKDEIDSLLADLDS